MAVEIRLALTADNGHIAAIWNREVLATAATTDTEPRTPAAQRAWLRAHAKPSYRRTVEDSVYVKDGYRGKGVGGLVLERLVVLQRML